MNNTELHPLIIGRARYETSKDKVGTEHAASPDLLQNLNHYIPIATSDAHTAYTLLQLPWLKQHGKIPSSRQVAKDLDDSQLLMDHEHLAELRRAEVRPGQNMHPRATWDTTPTTVTTPDPLQVGQPAQVHSFKTSVGCTLSQTQQPPQTTPPQEPKPTGHTTAGPTSQPTGLPHRKHLTGKQRRHPKLASAPSLRSTAQATQRTIEQTLQQHRVMQSTPKPTATQPSHTTAHDEQPDVTTLRPTTEPTPPHSLQTRTLKALTLNVRGITGKEMDVAVLIQKYDPDICILTETRHTEGNKRIRALKHKMNMQQYQLWHTLQKVNAAT